MTKKKESEKKGKKSEKKGKTVKKKKRVEKNTVRCRNCFMVDSYTADEKKCKHCGVEIYIIDAV